MSDAPMLRPPSQLDGFSFSSGRPPGQDGSEPAAADVPPARRRLTRRWGIAALLLFMAAALAGGIWMVKQGAEAVPQDAPLPAQPDYIAPADQAPVGADGIGADGGQTYPVENADTGGGEAGWIDPRNARPVTQMNVEKMEPMSVFVPEAKMYSLARASDEFSPSKYPGMSSIEIPENPHRTVWHSAGGAMASVNADGTPAEAGTTFLGSHSGYAGRWGAYLHLAYLQGGETVWTKDGNGVLQRWQVDRIRYMPHTQFPQEYWKADGDRRLVLATCGGTVGADGVYNQNVFVEAKPVEADGSPLQRGLQ